MKNRSIDGLSRRELLTGATTSTGLLGLATPMTAFGGPLPRPGPTSNLASLAVLRNYEARRSGSWDRTGGNNDFVPEAKAGEVITLMDVKGPGQIAHIWMAPNTLPDSSLYYLKQIVLRAYWDGEENPSVEAPIGDFFGLGLGELFTYESALTNVSPCYAMNCYFPMPFNKSAKLTLVNEGPTKIDNYYFNIDWVSFDQPVEDVGYFHAQYRQEAPCRGWTNQWQTDYEPGIDGKKNVDGKGNYVFFEAEGRGHFVGVTQSVLQNQDDWFGEGDEMIFIDGSSLPVITGTGTEDYYNGAWDFRGPNGKVQPYAYPYIGCPFIQNPEKVGGRYCLYRWHLEAPIPFRKNIKVTIEHGHANHRSDNFYTVGYWYQTEPHKPFPPLPKAEDRTPRVFDVGGPGIVQSAK